MAIKVETFLCNKVFVGSAVLFIIWLFRDVLIYRPYKKYIAWLLSNIAISLKEGLQEEKTNLFKFMGQYKEHLNRDISVLEIGSGSNTNLAYLPQNTKLVCLEPNPYFNDYANENIKKEESSVTVETIQGYAEAMPFGNETFDVVISTLVLCSVKDITKSIAEIKRVLKPGGKFVFFEHVAHANKLSWRYIVQIVMNPVHVVLIDGCNTIRDIGADIKAARFSDLNMDWFLHKPFPLWFRPCIRGVATK